MADGWLNRALAAMGLTMSGSLGFNDTYALAVKEFLVQLGVPEEERLFGQQVLGEMAKHDWPGNASIICTTVF